MPLQAEQVFEDYMKRIVRDQQGEQGYSADDSLHWLGLLARQMQANSLTIFTPEDLQPSWLPAKTRTAYLVSVSLAYGIVVILFFPLLGWFIGSAVAGLIAGLLCTLVFVGLNWLVKNRVDMRIERVGQNKPGGVIKGFKSVIGNVIGFGLIIVLLEFLSGNMLKVLLQPAFFIIVLILVLNWGLITLLSLLLSKPWGMLSIIIERIILRYWLIRNGIIPKTYIDFLERFCASGLLKRIGTGYSFRHPLLQEHCAQQEVVTPSNNTPKLTLFPH
ncbi:hypothetical protein [Ktedonospora formicarum]|uniref:Uncharacterized protein n=1 Tax=Ktedonospora formicarum TaxID=2778364 RepID=A0A8J3MVY0_9CHLR|nr:hypothetical protein [Ktedonospora formicarum]GHO48118.1 hypothetical protein KSX_62810 [Ktedonospora formicarum]